MQAKSYIPGSTISILNVRSGDGIDNQAIGQIAANKPIVIKGRNRTGDWFLIRAVDNSIRGWVVSRYIDRPSDLAIRDIY